MKQVKAIRGQDLRDMFAAANTWLEKSAPDIDALNVFPVPDGDTGTNMLLTMRSGVEEAFRAPDHSAAAVAKAMAKGTLSGARGNSGVILSQIWRGLAEALVNKESLNGSELAIALLASAKTAYQGLNNPVEGTILTVIREAAAAAQAAVDAGATEPIPVMEATVKAASQSVANTPALLPVLKEAGVVDAGGQGLYTILEGALRYLRGEAEQMQYRKPQIIVSDLVGTARPAQFLAMDEVPFGYCTEFLLKGESLSLEKIKEKLAKKGESLIVVGDESTVRIHVHTLDPGNVVHFATELGTMHNVSIRNMDEQHQDYLALQKENTPAADIATVAVVSGDGLAEVFKSLGAVVVPGGQTMNPSTKDLPQAVESVVSDKVIILPNNANIVLTAEQVQSLTRKSVIVVPSRTIPQGVAALLAFDYEADFKSNARLMKAAIPTAKSIEITRAARSTKLGGFDIKKKQSIGLLDGDLVAVGDTAADVLMAVLERLDLAQAEVITIYHGADIDSEQAKLTRASIREKYPQLQVDVVPGGQPHYDYIISVE
ncbi:MAG: DAK2 domain-containing protein [Chloroflexota bacterium]